MVPLIRGSQRYRLFLRPSDRILDRIIFFDTNFIKTIEIFDTVYICKLKLTEINWNLLQKGMGNGSGSFFFSIIVKRKSRCYSFLLQKSSKTEKISCPISCRISYAESVMLNLVVQKEIRPTALHKKILERLFSQVWKFCIN